MIERTYLCDMCRTKFPRGSELLIGFEWDAKDQWRFEPQSEHHICTKCLYNAADLRTRAIANKMIKGGA